MKIVIADDHPLFVDGLRNLLEAHGVEVVGTASDGLQVLDLVRSRRPDMILMDIHMPHIDGLTALRLVKTEFPELKVVMLTMSSADDELFEAIRKGASGYLLKSQDTETFFGLLQDVVKGEVALSPGLASRVFNEFRRRAEGAPEVGDRSRRERLSMREQQVLTLVANGLSYKEAGAKLFLSERTIKYHMAEIVARLQVDNRAQAIEFARRSGLV